LKEDLLRRPPPPREAPLPPELAVLGGQSDSDIWRAIKGGLQASPASDTASGWLMQTFGEDWRHFRREVILKYTPWILGGVLALILAFYLIRGRIPIEGGRSGRWIPRFSLSHRVVHWCLAVTFIIMGVTGLFIMLGRPLLLPLIGKEIHAALLNAALRIHNLLGPVFIVALVAMVIRFMRGNFFSRVDLQWLLKGGGLFGGHAHSHFYNFGEKTWYWVVVFVGLGMAATGTLLLFPWLAEDLRWLQLSTVLHGIGAVLMISFALGHMYVGSIGIEGALDGMVRGEVDENWAREHHDLWYEEVTGKKAGHAEDADASGSLAKGTS
jgi:formate dehydrogenase subunit gamma